MTLNLVSNEIMAKQDDFVRTQVRMSPSTHKMISRIKESKNCSMNEAILDMIHTGYLTIEERENENECSRSLAYSHITGNLHYLDIKQLNIVADVVIGLLKDKPLIEHAPEFIP